VQAAYTLQCLTTAELGAHSIYWRGVRTPFPKLGLIVHGSHLAVNRWCVTAGPGTSGAAPGPAVTREPLVGLGRRGTRGSLLDHLSDELK
jgi:hypothetical protein